MSDLDKNQNEDLEKETETSESEVSDSGEPEKKTPPYRGLYEHVHISVKALDIIIVACIVVIVVLLALDLRNPGFTITFDTKGGTPIDSQNQMYNESIKLPEEPIKKDATFDGWFTDPDCEIRLDEKTYKVHEDITLYAGWKSTADKNK